MRSIDRTRMARKHGGKWVALKRDRTTVVGSGSTVEQALRSAKRRSEDHPIVTKMPRKIQSFIGAHTNA